MRVGALIELLRSRALELTYEQSYCRKRFKIRRDHKKAQDGVQKAQDWLYFIIIAPNGPYEI